MRTTRAILIGGCLLLTASGPAAGEPLLDLSSGRGLYDNIKALDVGDVVTVIIAEAASANTSASTDTESKTEATGGPGLGLLDLVPEWGLDSETKFEGDGSSSRSGRLDARMTARVIERLANGNLRIEGTRRVEVNGERQDLVLRGIVRPRDIGSDNTVHSTYVADAEIVYRGNGPLDEAQAPGILSRVLNWIF